MSFRMGNIRKVNKFDEFLDSVLGEDKDQIRFKFTLAKGNEKYEAVYKFPYGAYSTLISYHFDKWVRETIAKYKFYGQLTSQYYEQIPYGIFQGKPLTKSKN